MLASLVMLGWMILRFGANIAKPFAGEMLPVKFVMERADGVSDGSAVTFRGVNVGRIIRVWRDPNQKDIWAEGEVDAQPALPTITDASIRQTSALGTGSNLILEPVEGATGNLKAGDTIKAHFVGLDLLPQEFKTLGGELAATAKQLRDENFIGNLNARVTQAGKMIDSAQQTLEGFNKIIGDPKLQEDLKTSLANVRAASDSAKSITANLDKAVVTVNDTTKSAQVKIDELSKSVQLRLDQAAATLDQVQQITTKVNAGEGTAGKLVNDPKLYAGLVDTTTELNATVKDLRRLIQQWEQEGVTAKLR
ncbi:MAG: Mammalian cell entry related domain protein [Phycisphaerales bacterium]|nr:Mammalian cell entry related domain protein [Phycisphaerales bacterium]